MNQRIQIHTQVIPVDIVEHRICGGIKSWVNGDYVLEPERVVIASIYVQLTHLKTELNKINKDKEY